MGMKFESKKYSLLYRINDEYYIKVELYNSIINIIKILIIWTFKSSEHQISLCI